MPERTQKTICRICEAHCGLEVDVAADDAIKRVRPDNDHPVSRGYACVKGLGIGALHDDPDRVNYPMKKVDGSWQRISWSQAIREIGDKVRALRKNHGRRSVAMYQGNPTFFSLQNTLYSTAFIEALGSPNMFASHSVDANNKFDVATRVYGRSLVHPVPDLAHTRFFMCLGSNPAVSQMSVVQLPNALQRLQQVEAGGGKVVVVDPRRTETAQRVGEHISIRPGTDAYLLLAMLHVISHEGDIDLETAKGFADGVDEIVAYAQSWSPETVAPITGIDAAVIRRLAKEYREADGAALYMSTGVNMGPFGSIAYWLVQSINLITGNVDRKGGLLVPRGAFDVLKLASWIGLGGTDEHRTLVGGWHRVAGCFPASALRQEIEIDHPERIRALFVSAGNPAHSVPNGAALRQALGKLELIVSVDIYRNETAAYADYILPATDMLERADLPASHMTLQETPHVQYTEAVVPPRYERRLEWQIYSELAMACGASWLGATLCNALPRINRWLRWMPGLGEITPERVTALLLRWGGHVTLAELKKHPEGVMLDATEPGSFLGKRVPSEDGRVNLWSEGLVADLPRLEQSSGDFAIDDGQLVLIGRRERKTHNSWMHNNPRIRQPDGNRALMHPSDAAERGLSDGDAVDIASPQCSVRLRVGISEDVRPGVIVVPHGWGHSDAEGLSRASKLEGANINEVIPGGGEHMEPVSGQAIMLAHRVVVTAAAATERVAEAG